MPSTATYRQAESVGRGPDGVEYHYTKRNVFKKLDIVYFLGKERSLFVGMWFEHRRYAEPHHVLPSDRPCLEYTEVYGHVYFLKPEDIWTPSVGETIWHERQRASAIPSDGHLYDMADIRAWYYPDEHTLVIWHAAGITDIKTMPEAPLESDVTLRGVWRRLEHFFLTQLPDTRKLVAGDFAVRPGEVPAWDRFIRSEGYEPEMGAPRRAPTYAKVMPPQ